MELTEENVLKVLAELGSTPDEIAKSLQAQGIKGWRLTCQSCPIAVYLQRKFPGCPAATASEITITIRTQEGIVQVCTPPEIKSFISRFDFGLYQELAI